MLIDVSILLVLCVKQLNVLDMYTFSDSHMCQVQLDMVGSGTLSILMRDNNGKVNDHFYERAYQCDVTMRNQTNVFRRGTKLL